MIDRYRRLARLVASQQKGGLMRDLMKVRAESVRMAALKGGWRRDSVALTGPDGAPEILWRGRLNGRTPRRAWRRLRPDLRQSLANRVLTRSDSVGLG
jgi:hypothetical protein